MSLADRDYFEAHVQSDIGSFVGEVLMPRLGDGQPFFSLSRRRQSLNGEFNGVIETSVSPHDFQNFYARMSSSGTNFALIRATDFRRDAPVSEIPTASGKAALRQTIVSAPDRKIHRRRPARRHQTPDRYRKLAGCPVTARGIETSVVRAEWLSMAVHLIFDTATAFLFSITALTTAYAPSLRRSKRREDAEDALRHAENGSVGQLTAASPTVQQSPHRHHQQSDTPSQRESETLKAGKTPRVRQERDGAAGRRQHRGSPSRGAAARSKPLKADRLVGHGGLVRQSLGETIKSRW